MSNTKEQNPTPKLALLLDFIKKMESLKEQFTALDEKLNAEAIEPKEPLHMQTLDIQLRYFDQDIIEVHGVHHSTFQFSVRQWRTWLLDVAAFCLEDPHHDLHKLGYLLGDVSEFCKIVESSVLKLQVAARQE